VVVHGIAQVGVHVLVVLVATLAAHRGVRVVVGAAERAVDRASSRQRLAEHLLVQLRVGQRRRCFRGGGEARVSRGPLLVG